MSRILSVVGEGSNVGKTTLIIGVVKELKERGFSVATIKHHGCEKDIEILKDSEKHLLAGADKVILSSKNSLICYERGEKSLEQILHSLKSFDVVIAEGYKGYPLKKIEVFREGISKKIISNPRDIIAIASSKRIFNEYPYVHINDYKKIANIIEELKE